MLLRRGVGPAKDPGKHVFVSYSHDDGEYVEGLREGLCDHVNVWIDRTEIPGSAPWREEVADGIRRSDVFLFVISPRSVASTECGLELDLAAEYGKRIVPLVLEPVPEGDLPEALAARQWTDGALPGARGDLHHRPAPGAERHRRRGAEPRRPSARRRRLAR